MQSYKIVYHLQWSLTTHYESRITIAFTLVCLALIPCYLEAANKTGADPGFYEGGFFLLKKRARIFKATPTRALTTPIFDQF